MATASADPLAQGRARTERTARALRITIPAKREWPLLLFLLFWFGAWTVAGITITAGLITGSAEDDGTLFTIFWLGGWALAWTFAFCALAWGFAGREEITIDGQSMTVSKVVGPYRRTKRFATQTIERLRGDAYEGGARGLFSHGRDAWRHNFEMWGLGGGSIVFDYGARTHRFGSKLDEAETRQLVDTLRAELRLPET